LDGLAYFRHRRSGFRFASPTLIHEVPHSIGEPLGSDAILGSSRQRSIPNDYWYMCFILDMTERNVVCKDFYAKHSEGPHVGVPRSRNIITLSHQLRSKPSRTPICEGFGEFNLERIVSRVVEKIC